MKRRRHASCKSRDSTTLGGMGVDEQATTGRYLTFDRKHSAPFNAGVSLPALPMRPPVFRLSNLANLARTLPRACRVQRRENSGQPSRPRQNALHGPVCRGNGQANRGVQLVDGAQARGADPRASRCSTGAWTRSSRCRSRSSRACASAKPRSSYSRVGHALSHGQGDQFSAADPRQQDISVFSASDREVLSEVELEKHFTGAAIRRNMVSRAIPGARHGLRTQAGYGIHIPTTTRTG